MPLPRFGDGSSLHSAAEKIAGIHTVSGGHGHSRALIIGKDRNAVWKETAKIDNQHAHQLLPLTKAAWEQKMQKHWDLSAGEVAH